MNTYQVLTDELVKHGRYRALDPGEEDPIFATDEADVALAQVELLCEHGEEAHVMIYGMSKAVCESLVAQLVQQLRQVNLFATPGEYVLDNEFCRIAAFFPQHFQKDKFPPEQCPWYGWMDVTAKQPPAQ
jgi:hypothetical protein